MTTTATTLSGGALVMPTLHSLFRRELRLAGGLVRGVASGDRRRAAVVADHLDLLLDGLHHHHTVEDTYAWPKLLERAPDELGPLVTLMQEQHGRVDALLSEAQGLVASFREQAGSASTVRLARLLDELHAVLVEHMDVEEREVMPLTSRWITAAEFDEMGEAGRSGTPKGQQALVLGMFAYEGDPAGLAEMLKDVPAPVRPVLLRLARRAYRKHARRVHGTPTP